MCKVVSREGIGIQAAFMEGMLPASLRYLNGARKRYGKSKPLCDEEQRLIDACLWIETLTGKSLNKAAIVVALANLRHVVNAADWLKIVDKRSLVELSETTIRLRAAGRAKANRPDSTPTIEALHRIVIGSQWSLYGRALKALIDHYPDPYSRADLATAADITPESFAHGHAIRSLSRQGLIVHTSDGRLAAIAALFPAKAMS